MEKKFGVFSSSQNPQELSATWEGAIKLLATILIGFGVVSATDGNVLIQQIGVMVPAGIAIYQAGQVLFGLARKLMIKK